MITKVLITIKMELIDDSLQLPLAKVIESFSYGKQSRISINIEEINGEQTMMVTKVIGKDIGLSPEQLRQIIADYHLYLELLEANKIKFSKPISIIECSMGNYFITKEVFLGAGVDLHAQMVLYEGQKSIELITSTFAVLLDNLLNLPPKHGGPYTNEERLTATPIDYKPANFVIHNGELILIDSFSPKLWEGDLIKRQPMKMFQKLNR